MAAPPRQDPVLTSISSATSRHSTSSLDMVVVFCWCWRSSRSGDRQLPMFFLLKLLTAQRSDHTDLSALSVRQLPCLYTSFTKSAAKLLTHTHTRCSWSFFAVTNPANSFYTCSLQQMQLVDLCSSWNGANGSLLSWSAARCPRYPHRDLCSGWCDSKQKFALYCEHPSYLSMSHLL